MQKSWKKIIALVFYISVIIFFVSYIKTLNFEALKKIEVRHQFLFITLFLSLLSRLLMPFTWITLIKEYGEKLKDIKALYFVYVKSWLGRYIPGKAAWIGGKIFFGMDQGINKRVLAISSCLEAGIYVSIGLLTSLLLFSLSGNLRNIDSRLQLFIGLASLVFLIGIFPPILNRILGLSYKLIKHKDLNRKYKLKFSSFIKVAGLFVGIQLVIGVTFGSIAKSVGADLNLSNLLYLSGTIILSSIIGILAVFAPSGIGVREGIQAVLLTPIMPKEQVVIIILLSRVVAVVADILFFGISWKILRKRV